MILYRNDGSDLDGQLWELRISSLEINMVDFDFAGQEHLKDSPLISDKLTYLSLLAEAVEASFPPDEEAPSCTICGKELIENFVVGLPQLGCPIHSTRGVPS